MLIAKLPLTATICLRLDDPRQSRMHVPSEYTAFVREHISSHVEQSPLSLGQLD
jgi:hypothetical protein